MTPTSATQERSEQATEKTAIRPFRVNVPDAELTEMRRRITATRILVNPDYGRRGSINVLQHWQSLFKRTKLALGRPAWRRPIHVLDHENLHRRFCISQRETFGSLHRSVGVTSRR